MINLVALPCLCVDVFDGTDELRAGGEALNFAVHASKFEEFNVSILGAVGQDSYAKFIMDSVSDKRIDVSHVRVEEDKVTANNRILNYDVPGEAVYEIEKSFKGIVIFANHEKCYDPENDHKYINAEDFISQELCTLPEEFFVFMDMAPTMLEQYEI